MNLNLAGKVVIVTGATANIGRAIAMDFANEGAKLVAVGRDEEAGNRVVAEALSRGAQAAVFVRADMLDPTSPARILEIASKFGPIDVLVNNVGSTVGAGFFVDSTPETCVAPYGTMSDDPAAYSRGSRFHPDNDFFRKTLGNITPADRAKRQRTGVLERPLAKPEDVSAAVLYFASDRASFITGQIFTVDGGTLL